MTQPPSPRTEHTPGPAEPSPSETVQEDLTRDDVYYEEVRNAVGEGTFTILLGTSRRSLRRSLARLRQTHDTSSGSYDALAALIDRGMKSPVFHSTSGSEPKDPPRPLPGHTPNEWHQDYFSRLAFLYGRDWGTPTSQLPRRTRLHAPNVAWARLLHAVDEGDADAMVNLGVLLLEQGDEAQAVKWFRKAADTGDADAMVNLGVTLREQGEKTEALKWFRKAADAEDES